jgi:hypothetical protein
MYMLKKGGIAGQFGSLSFMNKLASSKGGAKSDYKFSVPHNGESLAAL